MASALRKTGLAFSGLFARSPTLARHYLTSWAWLLGFLDDASWLKRHIGNNLRCIDWPNLKLKPRSVELAPGASALLVPIPGSLGFRSIYERRLGHEPGVPDFLASRMSNYDAVLEIGANVGVYTLLFSQLLPRDGTKRVLAYEPGQKAFECLTEHLALNGATNVAAFNCAVAASAGTVVFHENGRDFMKGAMSREVADMYTGTAPASTVKAVSGEQVAPHLQPFERWLFKIDVMGAEPEVLSSLQPAVLEKVPDILLGVWQPNLDGLNSLGFLREHYDYYKIDRSGQQKKSDFSDTQYCNYFLKPKRNPHASSRSG